MQEFSLNKTGNFKLKFLQFGCEFNNIFDAPLEIKLVQKETRKFHALSCTEYATHSSSLSLLALQRILVHQVKKKRKGKIVDSCSFRFFVQL